MPQRDHDCSILGSSCFQDGCGTWVENFGAAWLYLLVNGASHKSYSTVRKSAVILWILLEITMAALVGIFFIVYLFVYYLFECIRVSAVMSSHLSVVLAQ